MVPGRVDWCGLFGLRGGAPRRAKRGGSQWEACFEESSDEVGGRRQPGRGARGGRRGER